MDSKIDRPAAASDSAHEKGEASGALSLPQRLKRGPSVPTIEIADPVDFNRDFAKSDPNPQIGGFPIEKVQRGVTADGFTAFHAQVRSEFIEQHVLSRGRPHFAGLHGMMLNDALAIVLHTNWQSEPYGEKYRVVETQATFQFFQERFIRGSVTPRDGEAVPEVDSWEVLLKLVPKVRKGADHRSGVAIVEYIGIDGTDKILMARSEVAYLRRNAIARSDVQQKSPPHRRASGQLSDSD